jgi:hypothetical protein
MDGDDASSSAQKQTDRSLQQTVSETVHFQGLPYATRGRPLKLSPRRAQAPYRFMLHTNTLSTTRLREEKSYNFDGHWSIADMTHQQ